MKRWGSDPTVDLVAAALASHQRPTRAWDEMLPSTQSYYRGQARAALTALASVGLTPTNPEKEQP